MRDGHGTDDAGRDTATGHETRDLSTRVVVIFGVSLFVGAVIVHLVVWLLYAQFAKVAATAYPQEYPMAHVGAPEPPPDPSTSPEAWYGGSTGSSASASTRAGDSRSGTSSSTAAGSVHRLHRLQ